MVIKLDDFIPIFPAPIELIQYHSNTDMIFFDQAYTWHRIHMIRNNFEKNYYLCKHRCPVCLGSIFRKDNYMDTRFYCEKCNYAIEAWNRRAGEE